MVIACDYLSMARTIVSWDWLSPNAFSRVLFVQLVQSHYNQFLSSSTILSYNNSTIYFSTLVCPHQFLATTIGT